MYVVNEVLPCQQLSGLLDWAQSSVHAMMQKCKTIVQMDITFWVDGVPPLDLLGLLCWPPCDAGTCVAGRGKAFIVPLWAQILTDQAFWQQRCRSTQVW